MSIEETFREALRKIAKEEYHGHHDLVSADEWCKSKGIHYTTLWRAEKRGEVKLTRIGKRVFINPGQFAA